MLNYLLIGFYAAFGPRITLYLLVVFAHGVAGTNEHLIWPLAHDYNNQNLFNLGFF